MKRKHDPKELAASIQREEDAMIGGNLNFAASEAYKLLRTNLMFSLPDEKKCRVVGITSSIPGEGKSTTSINLAYALAETGQRVLLMELDMRLPNIARRVKTPLSPGLSNVLAGLNRVSESIYPIEGKDNLFLLPAGEIPPNPSELLGSRQMEELVETLSESFDFIIFDLPPVTVVSDALTVSGLTGGMVMVVRRNYSNQSALAEAMRQLKFSNVKLLGFVMTQAEEREKKYKSYSYSGRKYYQKYDYAASGSKEKK